jgi:hypothetical protein
MKWKSDLSTKWDTAWPEVEPFGSELRSVGLQRWVRLHSLPQSKRYPDSSAEVDEVLYRHNAVLGHLCQGMIDLYVMTCSWSATLEEVPHAPLENAQHWMTYSEDDAYRHVYVEQLRWETFILNELLLEVAEERVNEVIIAPANLSWLAHPYDGGIDVIANPTLRIHVAERFAPWMSLRSDGL